MSVFLSLQVDSERSDASHLKRENQTLLESCDSLEKSRQKVVHDLGIKEQQVGHHQNIYKQCRIFFTPTPLTCRIHLRELNCSGLRNGLATFNIIMTFTKANPTGR